VSERLKLWGKSLELWGKSLELWGKSLELWGKSLELWGKSLVPFSSGRRPYTLPHGGEQAAAAFPGETPARLRDLKRARDPRNVIRANFPVLG
jgi:hypothetical protein